MKRSRFQMDSKEICRPDCFRLASISTAYGEPTMTPRSSIGFAYTAGELRRIANHLDELSMRKEEDNEECIRAAERKEMMELCREMYREAQREQKEAHKEMLDAMKAIRKNVARLRVRVLT